MEKKVWGSNRPFFDMTSFENIMATDLEILTECRKKTNVKFTPQKREKSFRVVKLSKRENKKHLKNAKILFNREIHEVSNAKKSKQI